MAKGLDGLKERIRDAREALRNGRGNFVTAIVLGNLETELRHAQK